MSKLQKQSGFVPLVVVLIVGALSVGSVATVTASDNAKPGDILFPIDTAIENVRLNFIGNPESIEDNRFIGIAPKPEELHPLSLDTLRTTAPVVNKIT